MWMPCGLQEPLDLSCDHIAKQLRDFVWKLRMFLSAGYSYSTGRKADSWTSANSVSRFLNNTLLLLYPACSIHDSTVVIVTSGFLLLILYGSLPLPA